jgi:hypothetical protein
MLVAHSFISNCAVTHCCDHSSFLDSWYKTLLSASHEHENRMQVMCRRLRPLVATRVRIPTPLANMLAAHGIPVEVPYQPDAHQHQAGAEGNAIQSHVFQEDDDAPLKPGKGARKPSAPVYEPIRSATDILALDASTGEWVLDARQRQFGVRLQHNIGSLCVCYALLATAVVNVLTMPLLLDTAVFTHPRAQIVSMAALDSSVSSGACLSPQCLLSPLCTCLFECI